MTKFFLENAGKKKHSTDYRVIGYYKLLECIKKVRLFLIQRVVKKLRKEPTKELEHKLTEFKGCHASTMRKLAVYMLKNNCNMNLEKQSKFFSNQLGCDVESALSEIEEEGNNQLKGAVEKHTLFQKFLDETQTFLGRVEKKINQTKQKKEMKRERVKARRVHQQERKELGDVDPAEPQIQPVNLETHNKQLAPKPESNIKRVKTRYDNRPKPRTEFKKTGRNKHLQKEKQAGREDFENRQKAPNPYLSSNQSTHPSWKAKQQLSKIEPFQGKRIILS